jgi:tripartite-type tricarboxylate transporter receptor subunit TctC
VPCRGGAPALTDLLGAQVQVYFGPIPESIEHTRAGGDDLDTLGGAAGHPDRGRVRAGLRRERLVRRRGAQGAPVEIINRLNTEINAGLADPKMKVRVAEMGETTLAASPAAVAKLIAGETETWEKVIRAANIKPE